MHSKNKAKAHQIKKKKERRICGSLRLGACEVAGVWAKGQTFSRLHTHIHTRLPFSEQLLSPLHAGTSLGNHHDEAPPKNGHRGPPKSESVCLPPPSVSPSPSWRWCWVPGKDSEFMVRLPIELTGWLFAQFTLLFSRDKRRETETQ